MNKLLSFLKKNKNVVFMVIVLTIVCGLFCVYKLMQKSEGFGLSQTGKELVFFSMPGCPHCDKFKPTWDLLRNNYGNTAHIEIVEVSSNERPDLVQKYGISSFPTIVALKEGELVGTFEEDRNYENLVRYMNYHISN